MTTALALLIYAVFLVEGNPSGGYADKGESLGPLCVTQDCLSDVNRKYGTHYKWQDMRDYSKASDVFIKYTATAKDFGERTRIWNKGHRGKNKHSAWHYQAKVMRILKELL